MSPEREASRWMARLVEGSGGSIHLLRDDAPATVTQALDRGEVRRRAEACAATLLSHGIAQGDRIVLALPTGADFIGWFLGALWIGAVPVPVPVPLGALRGPAGVERFENILENGQPTAVIGDKRVLALARKRNPRMVLLTPDAAQASHAEVPFAPDAPERPAFIQYTAGSTGSPKGVVVTFGNLRANLEAIGKAVSVTRDDRVVSWLPLFHDMGLVGTLLFSLYWRLSLFLFSPVGFVLRPVGWLEAISTHRGTLSAAPHFAYSLCAHKLPDEALRGLDLSTWRLALDGAEPIRAENVQHFIDRMAPFGFRREAYYPVYGLSEATLAVTFPALGEGIHVDRVGRAPLAKKRAEPQEPGAESETDALSFVSVGRPLDGMAVEIHVGSDPAPAPERQVGEIWVRGPSVSPRYLKSTGPDRDVLKTGDLGYIADGRLYVADRIKDLIIQGGANIYPSDIEAAASQVPGVRKGRVVAFGVASAEQGTENVVVAAEVRVALKKRKALAAQIRAQVLQRCGVTLSDVALVEPRTLHLTTSGKLMRRRVRDLYTAGKLKTGVAGKVGRIITVMRAR